MEIPELGFGTWNMGGNPEKDVEAVKTAIDAGLKFIDTAEIYGSEYIVGESIKGRKGVFVATKVSPDHFRYRDVIESCDKSLKSLVVEEIDLYQLHWPNHSVPIGETMKAMEDLVDVGKIRHIGVSNFNVKELVDAQNAMQKYSIVSNQVEYSIFVRQIERNGILDFCTEHDITVIAYSPLGSGALYNPKNAPAFQVLDKIGKKHGKTPTQVALNWLISKENVVAIPKAANRKHVLELAGSSGWKLAKGEIKDINAIKETKHPLVGDRFQSIIKATSLSAKIMRLFNKRRLDAQRNRRTTKSSKK